MASISKHGEKWRAQISKRGVRESKVFRTRREAADWAARREYELANWQTVAGAMPFDDLLARYAREVSPSKRGHRWEVIRLEQLSRDPLGKVKVRDLSPQIFAAWRDRRLRSVSPGTVRREWALLSGVLSVARREWGVLSGNPLEGVRKPAQPPARDRLVTPGEMALLQQAAGDDLTVATARAFHAFRFACETGMRAGEIVGLHWRHVDLTARVVHVAQSKNGTSRDVPLTSEAVRLLEALPEADPVFGLTSRQLDALWRKVRDRAGVVGLSFHDSRHTAITRLAKVLNVLELARAVGHKDVRQLMTYFNETAAELAKRLD